MITSCQDIPESRIMHQNQTAFSLVLDIHHIQIFVTIPANIFNTSTIAQLCYNKIETGTQNSDVTGGTITKEVRKTAFQYSKNRPKISKSQTNYFFLPQIQLLTANCIYEKAKHATFVAKEIMSYYSSEEHRVIGVMQSCSLQ